MLQQPSNIPDAVPYFTEFHHQDARHGIKTFVRSKNNVTFMVSTVAAAPSAFLTQGPLETRVLKLNIPAEQAGPGLKNVQKWPPNAIETCAKVNTQGLTQAEYWHNMCCNMVTEWDGDHKPMQRICDMHQRFLQENAG